MPRSSPISDYSPIKSPRSIEAFVNALSRASHASRSARPICLPATPQRIRGIFGRNSKPSFAYYDRNSSSWKTWQPSFHEITSDEYSGNWPRWGTIRNGVARPRKPAVHPIAGIDSGSHLTYPTPKANDADNRGNAGERRRKWPGLHAVVADELGIPIGETIILNPVWIEWLMDWPQGWTDPVAPVAESELESWDKTPLKNRWDKAHRPQPLLKTCNEMEHNRQRIKALGNGVVPSIAAQMWALLMYFIDNG